ncbi:hypothetical protein SAMN05421754_10268 [Nitrosomonas sp. Nm58]|nr:hypothetical protein SAMN05421754_10268 [Nitrosomonas sp. Nm58]
MQISSEPGKNNGTKIGATKAASIIPPIIPAPIDCRAAEPTPDAITRGIAPIRIEK